MVEPEAIVAPFLVKHPAVHFSPNHPCTCRRAWPTRLRWGQVEPPLEEIPTHLELTETTPHSRLLQATAVVVVVVVILRTILGDRAVVALTVPWLHLEALALLGRDSQVAQASTSVQLTPLEAAVVEPVVLGVTAHRATAALAAADCRPQSPDQVLLEEAAAVVAAPLVQAGRPPRAVGLEPIQAALARPTLVAAAVVAVPLRQAMVDRE